MENPLISVIIPAYNSEKRLGACLKSVCEQDWDNLEIIVVDDGSTDGTSAIVKARAEADPRIRLIRQENGGVTSARNRALDACTGEWVRFVDSDDQLTPGSIRALLEIAENDGSEIVMAGYEHQWGGICKRRNLADRDGVISCDEYLFFLNKKANSFFCGVLWNKLFRRDLIEKRHIRFQGGLTFGEDFLFVCDYLKEVSRVSFSRKTVYRYVRHPHSMTVSQSFDSVKHPIRNIRVKWRLYRGLRELYIARGLYSSYFRRTLWMYMIRVTLQQ